MQTNFIKSISFKIMFQQKEYIVNVFVTFENISNLDGLILHL